MEQGLSFGGYRFDTATGRLWCGTREVRLTPKASAVLGVLVTNAGQPVSKAELFASVWSDTVVSDDALTSCIQELRRALEDDARQPRFIDAHYYFARSSFASGDIVRSAELFARAADVRQEDFQSPNLLAQSLRMLGRFEEARRATRESVGRAERVITLNPVDARALSMGSLDLLEDGQPARALEWSRRSLDLYPHDLSTLLCAACLSSRLGRKDEALDFLERVFARGWGKRDWIEHDPDYDSLRDDPRFKALVAQLK